MRRTPKPHGRFSHTLGRHAPSCSVIRRIALATVFATRDAVSASTLRCQYRFYHARLCLCVSLIVTVCGAFLGHRSNYDGPDCGRSKNWPLTVRTVVNADGSSFTTAGRPIALGQEAVQTPLKQGHEADEEEVSGINFDGLGSIVEDVPDADGYVLYFSEHSPS